MSNTNDSGSGSLRQAITDANAAFAVMAEPNTIVFRIGRGPATIQPVTPLPVITGHITINGAAQPGFTGAPLIEISGALAPDRAVGLEFRVTDTHLKSVVKDLVINRFRRAGKGILITGESGRVSVLNCYVGTTRDGLSAAGNTTGIGITGSAVYCSIGGTNVRQGNLISGNLQGIEIHSPSGGPNTVQGNLIGTDVTGMRAITGSSEGIRIASAYGQTIGGTRPGARNIISGNVTGIIVGGSHNVIEGNYIGLNRAGTAALANYGGLFITGDYNRIGGAAPGAGNVIAGNTGDGVTFSGPNCRNNVVQGNRIGVTPDGTQKLWNGGQGIILGLADENLIGGETPAAGNIISSAREGIWIVGGVLFSGTTTRLNSTRNRVLGNAIGIGTDDRPIGCGSHGIRLEGATQNVIGGTISGQSNVIAYNAGDGIVVRSLNDSNDPPATRGNRLRGNRIFANSGLSINLQPPGEGESVETRSDNQSQPFDADDGPNDLQNPPEFISASFGSGDNEFQLSARLRSTPNTTFIIDFYQTEGMDVDGNVENYISSLAVTTNADGIAPFVYRLDQRYGGKTISATATNPAGSTSEVNGFFNSSGVMYLDNVVHLSASTYTVNENAGAVEITIVRESGFGEDTVSYETRSSTAIASSDFRDTRGVVRFASGQRIAKVLVPIANDGRSEGNEVFLFDLTYPGFSAFLGQPAWATVTIIDDDLTPTANDTHNDSAKEGNG